MHLHPFEKSFVDQDFLQAINQPHEAMHTKYHHGSIKFKCNICAGNASKAAVIP